MKPLVVIDADVLGRQRTGDETYVENLLRHLPALGGDLRFAAITRHPELVPEGIEAIELPARSQEVRMAWSVPRLLRSLRPALSHFQHALPPRAGAAVRHRPRPVVRARADLHGPRRPGDLQAHRPALGAPRSARDRGLGADEARPDRALRRPRGEDHRHPARSRPRLRAGRPGAARLPPLRRCDPGAQGSARRRRGGRAGRDAARRRRPGARARARPRARGSAASTSAATSRRPSSPSSTAAPQRSCSRAGSRASACRCWRRWRSGTPVVASDDPALREVAGEAAVFAGDDLAGAIRAGARRPRPARRRRARAREGSSAGTRPRG